MSNLRFLLVSSLAFYGFAAAQDISDWNDPQGNSIKQMVQARPPRLQGGFTHDDDQWMLYSSKFDALSRAAQEGLLRKYGYLALDDDGPDFDWLNGQNRRSAAPAPASRLTPLAATPPPAGANVKVTADGGDFGSRTQSETTIAAFGDNVVVGYNDAARRVSYSRDGGATWRTNRLPTFPGTSAFFGDPVVVASSEGRFYHAFLGNNGVGDSVIAVSRSDDGGASWGPPVNATARLNGDNSFQDKEWLAIDNTPGSRFQGNLYISWTRFGSFFSQETDSIRLVRSTDAGRTWSRPATITALSTSEQATEIVQLSYVATGPDGEVYVAWWDSRVDGVRLVKSTDGGQTFSDPATILPGLGIRGSVVLPGPIQTVAFPQIAVDRSSGPNRGNVYVTVITLNDSLTTGVLLVRSTDRGATWSRPIPVGYDPGDTDKFHPTIAVGENGNVAVAFYDRRNDPENDTLTDVYVAISTDGGQTFPLLQRVTTTNWQMLSAGTRALGEYNHMVAAGGKFYVSWGDNRSGQDADVYEAWLPQTGMTPDFVFAATPPFADVVAGGSVSAAFSTPGVSGAALSVTLPDNQPGLTYQAAGTSIMFKASVGVMPGTYLLPVIATSNGMQRTTILRLTVHAPDVPAAPGPISGARNPAFQVRAVADAAGNLHTVSVREFLGGGVRRIAYQRVLAGTRVGQLSVSVFRTDYGNPEQTVSQPGVGVDGNGKVYVAWLRTDRTGSSIMMSSSTDGQTFSDAKVVVTSATRPLLSVGKNGTVYLAYVGLVASSGSFLSPTDLFLIVSQDGGTTFSQPLNVSKLGARDSISTSTSPAVMTLDSQDNPHLLWYVFSTNTTLVYRRSTDGGVSLAAAVPVSLPADVTGIRQAALAVDPTGAVYVAFNVIGGTSSFADILVVKSADGTKFDSGVNVSHISAWTGELTDWPSLAVDSQGVVTAVWREWVLNPLKSNDTNRDVFVARSSDGGQSYSNPVNLSGNIGDTLLGSVAGASLIPPAVAVDAGGHVFVLWDDDTAGSTQIWMAALQ